MDQSSFTKSAQWVVLRCPSSKTLQLTKRLDPHGAWTPIWQRRRRKPRSHKFELMDLPAIPSFVFVPCDSLDALPDVTGVPYSTMKIDGCIVRIPDRELSHLRKIDQAPKSAPKITFAPGQKLKFHNGPFSGLNCKVVYHSSRYVQCMVEGFPQPLKIASCLLEQNAA